MELEEKKNIIIKNTDTKAYHTYEEIMVDTLKKKIEEEKENRNSFNRLKQQLEESMPFLKEKFLNDLIQGNTGQDIESKLRFYDIRFNMDYFQTAVIETEAAENSGILEEEKMLLGMQCVELVKRYFRDDRCIQIFLGSGERIVIVNSQQSIDLEDCCQMIRDMVLNHLKCFINIGIGNAHDSVSGIAASYGEAVLALNYKVIAGKNSVVGYNEIVFSSRSRNDHSFNTEAFSFNLKAGIADKAVEFIDLFYSHIEAGANPGLDYIRTTASNIISVILNVASEFDIKIDDIFKASSSPFEKVFKTDNLPEIKSLLKEMAGDVIQTIKALHKRNDDSIIKQIQDFLKENMSSYELSLTSVAEKFHINASYLSRLFKKEMGVNFVEYLTKIRIEKAIKLLQETEMKVYKVGEAVGIYDPHYFSICFKKYTGFSVNDYKKNINGDNKNIF